MTSPETPRSNHEQLPKIVTLHLKHDGIESSCLLDQHSGPSHFVDTPEDVQRQLTEAWHQITNVGLYKMGDERHLEPVPIPEHLRLAEFWKLVEKEGIEITKKLLR